MNVLRSLLYTPGNRPKMLEKAPNYGADALIFDLEDTVPADQKAEARLITCEYITKYQRDCLIYARVNALETGMLREDLEAVCIDGLRGIMLPKVNSPDTVRTVDAILTDVERSHGLPHGKIEVGISLETARGVYFAYDIAMASTRVTSVTVGIAEDGDLLTDLGCLWSEDGTETLYVRSKVLLAARAAGIESPLDGVYANFRDETGFIKAAETARRLGYRGKKLIHPSQVEPANRVFMPTQKEIDYYQRVIEAFNAAVARGSASTSVDGKLVDYAMVANARRVLSWAESLGSKA